jgi:hypothetical protein
MKLEMGSQSQLRVRSSGCGVWSAEFGVRSLVCEVRSATTQSGASPTDELRTPNPELQTPLSPQTIKIILPTTSLLNSDQREIPQETTDDL